MGISLDEGKNLNHRNLMKKGVAEISRKNSKVKVLVVRTDEELEIALQTMEILKL